MMTDIPDDHQFLAHSTGIAGLQKGLHIFADGCFEPNSGQGGWAFVAYRNSLEIAADFGGVQNSANNAMELIALLKAATWLNRNAELEPAVIWSDSVYAVKGCNSWRHIWKNNGWKKIGANAKVRSRSIADPEIWKAVDLQLSENPLVSVAWCKGHCGVVGNERADDLADHGRLSMRTSESV